MIVKYIKGDIVKLFLEGKHVAHGCNCFHSMGAGVAGQLAKAYSPILSIDKAGSDYGCANKLGTFTRASLHRGSNANYCFNLYTQFEPGPNLDYAALLGAFIELDNFSASLITPLTVYIPRIGAGIAGGDWDKIELLINNFTPNTKIIVVDWDGE